MSSICLVVPTLGERLDLLAGCLTSVAGQGVEDLTVVVVGPSDSKARAVAVDAGMDYAAFDERGLSRAINHGWREKGLDADIWGWIGDDDLLAPGSLKSASLVLRSRPDAVAVYGRCRFGWSDGATQYLARPGRLAASWLDYGQDRVPQQGSLLSAAAVREVGWLDESLRYAMDADIFLRLKRIGRLLYLPQELGFYRQHSGAISYNKEDMGNEARLVRQRSASRRARTVTAAVPAIVRGVDWIYGAYLRRLPSPAPPESYTGRCESGRSWWRSLRPLKGSGPL